MASSIVTRLTGYKGLGTRMLLTLTGAAGLIIGGLLAWTSTIPGSHLGNRAFIDARFVRSDNFPMTAGFAMIAVGLVALLGLALTEGWLTRLAGALGLVLFALFAIEVYRTQGQETIGVGAWISLAGAFVALVAGFFGVRDTVVDTQPATSPRDRRELETVEGQTVEA